MITKLLEQAEYNTLRDSEIGTVTKYGEVTKFNRKSVIVLRKGKLVRVAAVSVIAAKHQLALINYLTATKQTAAQASKVLGVSPSYLCCVRKGTKPLSERVLRKMHKTVLEVKDGK